MSVVHFESTPNDAGAPGVADRFDTVAELKGKVDFAVITIKPEEFDAACRRFAHAEVVTGARPYAVARVPAGEGGRGGTALVAITCCPSQGNGVSQDVARDIIDELDPQWILVVGIAGAAPAAELTLGDVALASSLLDVSVEAVKHGRAPEFAAEARLVHVDVENFVTVVSAHAGALGPWFDLGLDRPPVDLEASRFYGTEDWQRETRASLEWHAAQRRTRPAVARVAMASSDRLVKDDEVLAAWMKVVRQIRAVEMESAGVYLAARGRGQRRSYPAMSIRGISDVVGFRRDDRWTLYACDAAAAFAVAFVRSGYVRPRAGAPRDKTTAAALAFASRDAGELCPPPGTPYDRRWYVHREIEEDFALKGLRHGGTPVLVWGPRRFGKSTLTRYLLDTVREADAAKGKTSREVSINLSLQLAAEGSIDTLLQNVAEQLVGQTGGDEAWLGGIAKKPLRGLMDLMETHILPRAGDKLIVVLEHADAAMLRSPALAEQLDNLLREWCSLWHTEPWSRLRLILVGSLSPMRFGEFSPFNLTSKIELDDLRPPQILELCRIYGLDWTQDQIEEHVIPLVGGHPFLLCMLMYNAPLLRRPLPDLMADEDVVERLFGEHLDQIAKRLSADPRLLQAVRQILDDPGAALDRETYQDLRWGDGVVRKKDGRYRIRYTLYENHFRRLWPRKRSP